MRQYKLQEVFDRASLNCLIYGTGFIKTIWDPDGGDIAGENDGVVEMEGDLHFGTPNPKDIYLDPDADNWDEVRFLFERILMPYEEAIYRWPDAEETLEKVRLKVGEYGDSFSKQSKSILSNPKYDVVEIYQYWEKGLPYNGMLGRYAVCTREGEVLGSPMPNPFKFSRVNDEGKELPPTAYLPYHALTDIDVPKQVYGKSVVEYEAPLQDTLNRLDSVTLDNIQAHGVARIILPEGTEVADDSITNSPWDIIKIKGTQPPHYMSPMPLPNSIPQFRDRVKVGIDDMAGVNESMFGQQSREQSGFSMQYATNQGNMIRRRLFNKYVLLVESVYKSYLNLVQKHWNDTRTIHVLGKEKAFEAIDIKGADINGGFDLVVEYGASLSLDPVTRREEIMTMMPVFEKAGVPTRTILNMLKLNELGGMYDLIQMADDRQREIFEEMIADGIYIPPEEMQDHENMMAYAMRYQMTTEFKYLEEDKKALIRRHVKERAQMAATEAQPQLPPGAPGPAGLPGQLPAGPEMEQEQAPVEALQPMITG
jgi:hypothetical protein